MLLKMKRTDELVKRIPPMINGRLRTGHLDEPGRITVLHDSGQHGIIGLVYRRAAHLHGGLGLQVGSGHIDHGNRQVIYRQSLGLRHFLGGTAVRLFELPIPPLQVCLHASSGSGEVIDSQIRGRCTSGARELELRFPHRGSRGFRDPPFGQIVLQLGAACGALVRCSGLFFGTT